jgi:hypothetical protein
MENIKLKIQKLLDSTNDDRFSGTISSFKRFFSLSNDVYKVDFSDGRSFVVKIEDPTNINLLTFYKPTVIKHLKRMEYGSEIFLYSENYLEIEAFIKSSCQKQENLIDPIFRDNMMRNAAEFNSLVYDSGKENLWNLIKERKVFEESQDQAMKEIIKYKAKFKLSESSSTESVVKMKDSLVGSTFFSLTKFKIIQNRFYLKILLK